MRRTVIQPAADAGPDGPVKVIAQVLVEREGQVVKRGSAVIVAAREEYGEAVCYLLTVGHVLDGRQASDSVQVLLPDGNDWRPVRGEAIQQVDAGERDLAVLRAIATCRPARIGVGPERDGDVWLAGFPGEGQVRVWPGHARETSWFGTLRWIVEGTVTEGASGGGVFDAQTGRLLGLIQGYWTARLVMPGGAIAGVARIGTAAVIPITRVRALLEEWGFEDLLDSAR
jgi:hypothetical protein